MNQKSKLTFGKIFERFSYGCGDFGCNIIYTAMSAFLLFYYTDYANVSAMAVGTIMMISRQKDLRILKVHGDILIIRYPEMQKGGGMVEKSS